MIAELKLLIARAIAEKHAGELIAVFKENPIANQEQRLHLLAEKEYLSGINSEVADAIWQAVEEKIKSPVLDEMPNKIEEMRGKAKGIFEKIGITQKIKMEYSSADYIDVDKIVLEKIQSVLNELRFLSKISPEEYDYWALNIVYFTFFGLILEMAFDYHLITVLTFLAQFDNQLYGDADKGVFSVLQKYANDIRGDKAEQSLTYIKYIFQTLGHHAKLMFRSDWNVMGILNSVRSLEFKQWIWELCQNNPETRRLMLEHKLKYYLFTDLRSENWILECIKKDYPEQLQEMPEKMRRSQLCSIKPRKEKEYFQLPQILVMLESRERRAVYHETSEDLKTAFRKVISKHLHFNCDYSSSSCSPVEHCYLSARLIKELPSSIEERMIYFKQFFQCWQQSYPEFDVENIFSFDPGTSLYFGFVFRSDEADRKLRLNLFAFLQKTKEYLREVANYYPDILEFCNEPMKKLLAKDDPCGIESVRNTENTHLLPTELLTENTHLLPTELLTENTHLLPTELLIFMAENTITEEGLPLSNFNPTGAVNLPIGNSLPFFDSSLGERSEATAFTTAQNQTQDEENHPSKIRRIDSQNEPEYRH